MKVKIEKIKRWIGFIRCSICLIGWHVRDMLIKPWENAVCFVAHPDDEILFFYSFLKEKRPYVVVLTGCSSVHRLSSLKKTMKKLGLRFRAYPLDTDAASEQDIRRIIKHIFSQRNYDICATHNSEGEYGHPMHQRVHQAVADIALCPVCVPASGSQIENYPLLLAQAEEKLSIFHTFYASEDFVPTLFGKWIFNEHLVMYNCAASGKSRNSMLQIRKKVGETQ